MAIAAWIGISGYAVAEDEPSAAPPPACTTDIAVRKIDRAAATRVIAKVPEYTQGLLFSDGTLYESTGVNGRSAVYQLDLRKGIRKRLAALDGNLFGEGLARIGSRFYQLTWRAGAVFVYEPDPAGNGLTRVARFDHGGEGWGLTDLDGELVLSDGSDALSFVDPQTFAVTRKIEVRLAGTAIARLNELETVDGRILANVYGDSSIIAIDPTDGCVTEIIYASRLVADVAADLRALAEPVCTGACNAWDFVLNGIAYDAATGELYLTGKNWPALFVFSDLFG